NGSCVLVKSAAWATMRRGQPFEQIDVQTLFHTVADRAGCWAKIPDIRPLNGSGKDEERHGTALIAVITQPPKRAQSNDLIRALARIQSQCSKRIALYAAQCISNGKLCPGQCLQRSICCSRLDLH